MPSPSPAGDSPGMQFQVRKAVAGAAAAAFDLEMPSTSSVNDLMEALAWDPGSCMNWHEPGWIRGSTEKDL